MVGDADTVWLGPPLLAPKPKSGRDITSEEVLTEERGVQAPSWAPLPHRPAEEEEPS